ncbi:hypothetical protein TWF506_009118 [Arthrobotrys conoides]|uniref:Uncharacterized protein n=1 Tax=Arthrobotrys conoides TaxID=74498 RepID=A0AAN8NI33_9PEZI
MLSGQSLLVVGTLIRKLSWPAESDLSESCLFAYNGIIAPITSKACVLAVLLSLFLQPFTYPDILLEDDTAYGLYLTYVLEILVKWVRLFIKRNKDRPRACCGMIAIPRSSTQRSPFMWLGTSQPTTKDPDTFDLFKKCRQTICEKTGVWSKALEKWDVGTCAETIPFSAMPIHRGRGDTILSLCLASKGPDKRLRACKTCQATFLSHLIVNGGMVIDLADSEEPESEVRIEEIS